LNILLIRQDHRIENHLDLGRGTENLGGQGHLDDQGQEGHAQGTGTLGIEGLETDITDQGRMIEVEGQEIGAVGQGLEIDTGQGFLVQEASDLGQEIGVRGHEVIGQGQEE